MKLVFAAVFIYKEHWTNDVKRCTGESRSGDEMIAAARRFSVATPRLWNSLPLNCRTAPSVNTFKIRLKTFLFDLA